MLGSHRRPLTVGLAGCITLAIVIAGLHHTAQAGEQPPVPTLPGVEERQNDLYDGDGCLRTGVDERDCSVTAEDLDEILEGDSVDDVRHLAGFTGSGWTEAPIGDRPQVLEDTVTVDVAADVELAGLVRNETGETIGGIDVTATLLDAGGEVITVLKGPAAVASVRSGEPVPFVVTAGAPGVAIDRIDWSASAREATPVARDLEWQSYWEQPAGTRDPVQLDIYQERGAGPHPHVALGSVRNIGEEAVSGVTVVTAWLDDSRRVAAVQQTPVLDSSGQRVDLLESGSMADALVVSDGVPLGAEALTWVSGS